MTYDNEALERAYARVFHLMQEQEKAVEYYRDIAFWSILINVIAAVVLLLEVLWR